MRNCAWFWLKLLCIVILVGCGGSGDDGNGPPVHWESPAYTLPTETEVPLTSGDILSLLVDRCFDFRNGAFLNEALADVPVEICYGTMTAPDRISLTINTSLGSVDAEQYLGSLYIDIPVGSPWLPQGLIQVEQTLLLWSDGDAMMFFVNLGNGVSGESDSGPLCGELNCVGSTLVCDGVPVGVCDVGCQVNADCDDGNVCNGLETCVAGVCQPGTPLVCDDGNICTDNTCDPAVGCVFVNNTAPCDDGNPCTTGDTCQAGFCTPGACAATGPAHSCCADAACAGAAVCQTHGPGFEGGVYILRVESISQTPAGCFLPAWLVPVLVDLIDDIPTGVELPAQGAYPLLLTLDIPFLGLLDVTARFVSGEVVFDEVDLDPIRLADFAGFLPPGFEWLMDPFWCVIDGKATGSTQGLDASGLALTMQIYDLAVTPDPQGSQCVLETPGPTCGMNVTVQGTRSLPPPGS